MNIEVNKTTLGVVILTIGIVGLFVILGLIFGPKVVGLILSFMGFFFGLALYDINKQDENRTK